jgi:DNA-binding protein YbaB
VSGRDDSDDIAQRREKEARNTALRHQIDNMLSDLRRRTQELQEKQADAAQKTHEVTSEDGVVTAKVDATGTLQELTLSPKAFERSTPERLARTITSVIREATGSAAQTLQADFAPLTTAPELPDIVPGAPSLDDFLPTGPLVTPPDPATERAQRTGTEPPASQPSTPASQPSTPASQQGPPQRGPAPGRRTGRDDDFDDDPPETFMTGGRW